MFPQNSTGRNFLLIIIVALLIAGGAVAIVLSTRDGADVDPGDVIVVDTNASALVRVMADVQAKVGGQPIHGIEPTMMMSAYPGIAQTDFQGAQANGGVYHVIAGTLQLARGAQDAVSSADGALTDIGIMMTLQNAARRLALPATTDADYAVLLTTLQANGNGSGGLTQQTITVTGEFVCLPHRDTSGPQTMECAFGIHDTAAKKYYALSFNSIPDQEWQSIEMRARITVQGTFVPGAALSSNMWQIYPIEGVIEVKSLSRPGTVM